MDDLTALDHFAGLPVITLVVELEQLLGLPMLRLATEEVKRQQL